MRIQVTDEQLAAPIQKMLARHSCGNPAEPNLNFQFALEHCDGPAQTVCYQVHTYPWMTNPNHVVHGGVIAAMLDSAMGLLCAGLYDAMTPTITMTINYALPVPLDEDIMIRVRAFGTARTSAQITGEIYLPGDPGTILVSAMGVYHTAHTNRPDRKRLSEVL